VGERTQPAAGGYAATTGREVNISARRYERTTSRVRIGVLWALLPEARRSEVLRGSLLPRKKIQKRSHAAQVDRRFIQNSSGIHRPVLFLRLAGAIRALREGEGQTRREASARKALGPPTYGRWPGSAEQSGGATKARPSQREGERMRPVVATPSMPLNRGTKRAFFFRTLRVVSDAP
jgi:hypothetical protein